MAKKKVKKKAKKTKAKKNVSKKASSEKGKWPIERHVLFRPDRLKYIKSQARTGKCVFCHALSQGRGFDSLLLYADENAMCVLNKYPYNNGHLLVLPTRHEGDITSLTQTEFQEVNDLFRFAIQTLNEEYEPQAINAGLNLGKASGGGIPEHLHYHVIPRWMGDMNFFPLMTGTKVIAESLEDTFNRLLPYFRKYRGHNV